MITHHTCYKLPVALVIGLLLTGCLKKDDIPDLSKTGAVIEFPIGGPGLKKNTLAATATNVVDTVVALNISSPDPLNTDVTATIKVDPALVDQYNTANAANGANGANYTALSDALFQIESTAITIKAGYRIGRIKLKIKFNQFDPNQKYMLALSIVNAPGCIVSQNFGHFLWAFELQ